MLQIKNLQLDLSKILTKKGFCYFLKGRPIKLPDNKLSSEHNVKIFSFTGLHLDILNNLDFGKDIREDQESNSFRKMFTLLKETFFVNSKTSSTGQREEVIKVFLPNPTRHDPERVYGFQVRSNEDIPSKLEEEDRNVASNFESYYASDDSENDH